MRPANPAAVPNAATTSRRLPLPVAPALQGSGMGYLQTGFWGATLAINWPHAIPPGLQIRFAGLADAVPVGPTLYANVVPGTNTANLDFTTATDWNGFAWAELILNGQTLAGNRLTITVSP